MIPFTGGEEAHPLSQIPMTRQCPFSPPQEYAQFRERGEWQRVEVLDEKVVWLVSDYATVREVLSNDRFTTERGRPGFPLINESQRSLIQSPASMVTTDEPEHSQIRRRATFAFTGKKVQALEESVDALIHRLIDDMLEAGGPLDLVTEFSLVVPSTVISGILGVPPEDHTHFHALTNEIFNLTHTFEQVDAGKRGLEAYLLSLVEQKKLEPQDDLISKYVTDYVATGELTEYEAVSQLRTLLVAGHETTASMIALGTAYLLENPDQAEEIRQGDELYVAGAVEELLRYLTIMHRGLIRMALEDVEIAGRLVRKGEGILCSLSSANRDAKIFADADRPDFKNPRRNHVAFGFGIHQCLGQGLARMEMRKAYKALLTRIPTLRLAQPLSEIEFKESVSVYGIHSLPVVW